MNITLHRTSLMVCVLAGALALAIVLVAARDVSAAPPEPVNDTFTVEEGVCDFAVDAEVSGKTKFIELPGGRFIATSPGARITLTNEEEPTHHVTYVITGALHGKDLESGDLLLVVTGRNLLFDPSYGMLLTIGHFSQVVDLEAETATPPEGKGRVIDVCQRLA
jgi:hypothetical protein